MKSKSKANSAGRLGFQKIILIEAVIIFNLLSILVGVRFLEEYVAIKRVDRLVLMARPRADVKFDKIAVDLFSMNIHLKKVMITTPGNKDGISIDELVIFNLDPDAQPPHRLLADLKGVGLKVDQRTLGAFGYDLAGIGLKTLRADARLDYTYVPSGKELTLNKLFVSIDNIGSFNLSFKVKNFDIDNFLYLSSEQLDIFTSNVMIYKASLNYEDFKFVNRLMKYYSDKDSKTPEVYTASLVESLEAKAATSEEDFKKTSLQSLTNFIKAPDKISINLAPDRPVTLGLSKSLESGTIPKIFGVRITSTSPHQMPK